MAAVSSLPRGSSLLPSRSGGTHLHWIITQANHLQTPTKPGACSCGCRGGCGLLSSTVPAVGLRSSLDLGGYTTASALSWTPKTGTTSLGSIWTAEHVVVPTSHGNTACSSSSVPGSGQDSQLYLPVSTPAMRQLLLFFATAPFGNSPTALRDTLHELHSQEWLCYLSDCQHHSKGLQALLQPIPHYQEAPPFP